MSDLISRKAILKHIEKIRQGLQMMDDTHRASIIMNGMYLCEKAVMTQPSAQSELIRCKDCKYWEGEERNGFYYFEHCSQTGMDALYDDFCSRAERREDG